MSFMNNLLNLETDLGPSFVVPAGETYILKLTKP